MDARLNVILSRLRDEMEWMDHANCRNMDTSLFFLADQTGAQYSSFAKEVCAECDVSQNCLDYANENMFDYGMFGGLSPKQRSRYRARVLGVPSDGNRGNARAVHDSVL